MIQLKYDLRFPRFVHNNLPNLWFVRNMTPSVLGDFRYIHNIYGYLTHYELIEKVEKFEVEKKEVRDFYLLGLNPLVGRHVD